MNPRITGAKHTPKMIKANLTSWVLAHVINVIIPIIANIARGAPIVSKAIAGKINSMPIVRPPIASPKSVLGIFFFTIGLNLGIFGL